MIDNKLYVGPYAKAWTKKALKDKTVRTCSNSNCYYYQYKNYGSSSAKFCGACGNPNAERVVQEEEDAVDYWKVMRGMDGRLTCPYALLEKTEDGCTHYWLPNIQIPKQRDFWGIDHVCFSTPELMFKEMAEFGCYFNKELAKLEEVYGKENVKLEWGVFHYES